MAPPPYASHAFIVACSLLCTSRPRGSCGSCGSCLLPCTSCPPECPRSSRDVRGGSARSLPQLLRSLRMLSAAAVHALATRAPMQPDAKPGGSETSPYSDVCGTRRSPACARQGGRHQPVLLHEYPPWLVGAPATAQVRYLPAFWHILGTCLCLLPLLYTAPRCFGAVRSSRLNLLTAPFNTL